MGGKLAILAPTRFARRFSTETHFKPDRQQHPQGRPKPVRSSWIPPANSKPIPVVNRSLHKQSGLFLVLVLFLHLSCELIALSLGNAQRLPPSALPVFGEPDDLPGVI